VPPSGGSDGQGAVRPRTARWRKWALRLALAVLSPLLFLGLAEAVLRVCGYGYPTTFLVNHEAAEGYVPNDHFTRRFQCPEKADPFVLRAEKQPGTVRIFVFGESAAYGTPEPAFSFGRVLGAMLRHQYPGARFEVINAALMGINSHAIRAIVAECAGHSPDLFIVYMGNNEVVGLYGADPDFGIMTEHSALIRAALWTRTTRLGQGLAQLMGSEQKKPAGESQDAEFFHKHRLHADTPRRSAVYDNFRRNLADICRTARAAKVRTIVSTVGVNLKDQPPLGCLHRADLSNADRVRWEVLYGEGTAAEKAGRYAAAIERYQAAAQIDAQFADLHFRLARCAMEEGHFALAREHYQLACDYDATPFRANRGVNEAIREVVGEHAGQGIELVDGEKALADCVARDHGVPGEELFYEHVHLTSAGNYALARAMLPAVSAVVAEVLDQAPAAAGEVLSEYDCAEQLALTCWDRLRMAMMMARLTSGPPFTNEMEHGERQERVERRVAELRRRAGPGECRLAREAYQAALRQSPDDWHLHYNYAALLDHLGEHQATLEHWQAVLDLAPSHQGVKAFWAQSLDRCGRSDEAFALYQEVLQEQPDCVPVLLAFAQTLLNQQKFDEAIERLQEAQRAAPHDPRIGPLIADAHRLASGGPADPPPVAKAEPPKVDPAAMAHYERGNALKREGKLPEAIEEFRRALAIAPNVCSFHNNLGTTLLAVGRIDDAITHLSRALELVPTHGKAHGSLGVALAAKGQEAAAVDHLRRAMELKADSPHFAGQLVWLLATASEDRLRDGNEAVRLAEQACRETERKMPFLLTALAAAYAEAGRFDDAVQTASAGLRLAVAAGDTREAARLAGHLELYKARKPVR
jgi:tetratricopeptide (TPR) repeat protein